MNSKRAIIIIIGIFLFFILLVAKLFDIQVVKSEELRYYAERQQTGIETINAERGFIYDRNEMLLVYNRNDISFYLDLRMTDKEDKRKIANKFSSVFGESRNHYLSLMKENGKTICLKKKIPSEKALLLKNFKADGLFYREDPTRIYHYGNFASHILGYMNQDYRGVSGIEKNYNEILQGEQGVRLVERNAIGDITTVAEEETKPSVPGDNIYLTIIKSYQTILEEELKKGLEEYGGTSSIGIMMDPNTGEILALANVNDYNPNEFWNFNDSELRNKAVTDVYEPGSTFKAITLATLFDQKLCKKNELIYVENGTYKFHNVRIKDTHKFNYLTVQGVFEQSSNIGTAKLVKRIDNELFYKYLRGFGFGNFTTINLPGEVKGSLKKPNEWSLLTKSYMAFGYEISVTPIQMAAAYSAIVNGGILYKPQIIKKIVDKEGIIKSVTEPKEIRRVISEETSSVMRGLMISVVEKGTGQNAKIDFLSIGGKTGTSKKLIDGKYSGTDYNSSFIGFYPAENPQVVCFVLVNSPKVGFYGGAVAAPIFKKITERIMEADSRFIPDQRLNPNYKEERIKLIYTNNTDDLSPSVQSVSSTKDSGIEFKMGIMPDLSNHSLRDAISVLTKLGLKYKVEGSGKVISQSINPGDKIKKGNTCVLNCSQVMVNGTVVY
jgi:cell division protein FtsI (penicillin-binding protein 3)